MSIRRVKGGGAPSELAQTLAELGFPARVEGQGTMALITLDAEGAARLSESPELRQQLVEAARAVGFATVAVEISA